MAPTHRTIMDEAANEIIRHGGLPMRRREVHKLTLAETGDRRLADHFAFRLTAPVVGTIDDPDTGLYTADDVLTLVAAASGAGSAA